MKGCLVLMLVFCLFLGGCVVYPIWYARGPYLEKRCKDEHPRSTFCKRYYNSER